MQGKDRTQLIKSNSVKHRWVHSSKIYSVENSAKWITDEHEEGSYDYKLRNLEEDND